MEFMSDIGKGNASVPGGREIMKFPAAISVFEHMKGKLKS